MFPVLNHLRELVSTLSRENAESHTRTIKQLLLSHGDEARIFYLSSLFDEIDWKDRSPPKDTQKILNLREEISQTLKLPNFVTLLCQGFEGGNRQRVFQSLPVIPDEFGLVNIASLLSLSLVESVAFSFALMHSPIKSVASHATMYFKAKLPEVTSFRELSEETTHSIIHLAISENMYPPELTKRILEVMRVSYPPQGRSQGQGPEGDRKAAAPAPAAAPQSRSSVSRTLNEIGFRCSRTMESFRQTLSRELEVSVLDETVIVDVLFCSLIPRLSGLDSLNGETASQLLSSLLNGTQLPPESQIEWWSIDVILTVFNEDCRNANWTNVLRCLDRVASPYLPTEAEFLLFMKLLSRVINRPVPAAGLMSIWDNRLFQLSCIGHAANTPRTLIDFTELISPSSRLDAPEIPPIPLPPNGSWLCVHLYSTLLTIASRGNNNEVMKLLADAAIQYPEYVFLGLAQTTDQNSGVRTELLRRLIRYFTGLNGSRPSSGVVMNRLYEVNQDLLVLILRISLKNSTTVQEIMNIDARLKNFGNSNGNNVLLFRIQEECTLDEILPYWCVIADYQRGAGSLHLEERLLSILVKNPSYARNIVLFAKAHIDTLRPRMSTEGSGGILSYENFVTILKCAQQYPTIVSTQDVRTLAGLANQRQQQQLQAAQQQIQSARDGGTSNPSSVQAPTSAGVRVGNQSQPSSVAPDAAGIARPPMSGGMEAPSSTSAVPASAPLSSSTGSGGSSEEIEEIANSYFQRIYTSNMTINDVIVLLKRFKTSTEPREQEIFRCMIHNLFDEYRFFHKYPDKELQLTGRLFGTLIQHQLVATITLGIALRYVLEALRKDPEQGGSNEKMFRFGKIALEQFRSRLGEWPQYCSHLVQIPHLSRHCADLYREAQRAISTSNPGSGSGTGVNPNVPVPVAAAAPTPPPASVQASSPVLTTPLSASTLSPSMPALGEKTANQNPSVVPISSFPSPILGTAESSVPTAVVAPAAMSEGSIGKQLSPVPGASNAFSAESIYESASQAQVRASASSSIEDQNPALESSPLSDSNSLGSGDGGNGVVEERRRKAIERMYAVNMEAPEVHIPSEAHRDQILFIINNIAKSNVEAKTKELKGILDVAHYNWFANYLIVKRISTQPNLHGTYIAVIDLMESSLLVRAIMLSGYHNVTKLLQSSKITNSSSERSLLRNLGIWLGQLTLSRNKPLLQRRCDLKELLLWGYEDGRLIAVCSFVAKILEGCKDSKVFRPPNPWLMSILGVMRELYEVEDLKMNIKFEVQVLCKNIGVKIEDIPRTHVLSQCLPPIKEKNPDFNVRASNQSSLSSSSPTPQASSPQFVMNQGTPLQTPSSAHHGSGYGLMMPPAASESQSQSDSQLDLNGGSFSNLSSTDQIVIPNLASHVVVNSSLYYLLPGANGAALLRRIVPLAVDKAILEIILPVVEKCVTMACVTTQHLVLKDFSQEPNESPLRRAAHQMISNLAGSLALVTCKEPLRVSISNHLRTLLSGTNMESNVIDQIVQKCSSDNLDLGCMLIEKAVTERAIRDIDEALAGPIKLRKKHLESGAAANTFSDTTSLSAANITNVITKAVPSSGKYPRDLPESMRTLAGGLTPSQLHVYDGFHRQKLTVPSPNGDSLASSAQLSGSQGLSPAPHSMSPSPQPLQSMTNPSLSMAQSLEAYQVSLSRVDNSLKAVMIQAQGRDVSLSMLGGDHEIVSRLREIMHITQCTQASVRIESALTFAESVFKRLVETVGVNDTLRLEVMVGILEALRDACGGSRKFIPDITGWLNAYATFSVSEEASRKVLRDILTLLMRAKLLSAADVDLYFANNLDGGRNMLWVEMSLAFILHSLAEGLAATYEYSKVFDIVAQMRPANPTVRKSLQKWLTDIRTLAAAREEQRSSSAPAGVGASGAVGGSSPSASTPPLPSSNPLSGVSLPPVPPVRDHARDQVVGLLDQWLRVWQVSDDKIFARYLQLLHQHGVLKTEEAADKFFRLSVEICVEASLKSGQTSQAPEVSPTVPSVGAASTISYTVVDALSKLFLLLIRLADKEATDSSVRINLLGRILNAGARVLVEDHESKKANPTTAFDQRPYYRLFANLLQDLGVLDSKQQMQDPNQSFLLLLGAYSQIFLALQPSSVPGFAFSWLQLISHRCFMPHLLQGRGPIPRSSLPQGAPQPKITSGWPYMHRLLLVLLQFLQPFLRTAQLIDPIRRLYKGTLKVLLVLLHDFPEFLADYHLSLCEAIPPLCVQLRNLVLSAFPRSMRLPDPFTPNLKIDLLPEIGHSPRILTDFVGILNERGLRPRLDAYLTTKQPVDFPDQLVQVLTVTSSPVGGGSLHPLLTVCVVMYAASYGINQLQQKVPITQGTPMDLWRHIVASVDPESRYAFLNILGNQLRYPNSHTHYFSCVLLNLFAESAGIGGEIVQEQITRVLLERLIVHRPHPWGLLVSFIELIKNPRYNFWSRPFVKCAPEIEKVFESVSRSCNGPSSNSTAASSSVAIPGGVNGGSVGGDDPK